MSNFHLALAVGWILAFVATAMFTKTSMRNNIIIATVALVAVVFMLSQGMLKAPSFLQ